MKLDSGKNSCEKQQTTSMQTFDKCSRLLVCWLEVSGTDANFEGGVALGHPARSSFMLNACVPCIDQSGCSFLACCMWKVSKQGYNESDLVKVEGMCSMICVCIHM